MTQKQQNRSKTQISLCICQSCVFTHAKKDKYVGTLQTSPKNNKKIAAPAGSWFFIHVQQNLSKVMVILQEIAIFLRLVPLFFRGVGFC